MANLIFPRIYDSITDFVIFLPTLLDQVESYIEYHLVAMGQSYSFNFDSVVESFSLDELLQNIYLPDIAIAFNTILSLSAFVFRIALALISSIYFMMEGAKIVAFIRRVLEIATSSKTVNNVLKYGRSINSYFKLYIRCQVLDAVILGTVMTIIMSIMGINYAFTLGPLLGFANLIPYFGSIIGTVIAIVVIFFTEGVTMGIISMIVLIVVQQIDANVIFPRLLGNSMKISPLLVIIGITIGNFFYGVIGMIMAIPIVTVLQNIITDILNYYEARKERIDEEVKDVLK
jgi:predicted PurR-regulated permease PerM